MSLNTIIVILEEHPVFPPEDLVAEIFHVDDTIFTRVFPCSLRRGYGFEGFCFTQWITIIVIL